MPLVNFDTKAAVRSTRRLSLDTWVRSSRKREPRTTSASPVRMR